MGESWNDGSGSNEATCLPPSQEVRRTNITHVLRKAGGIIVTRGFWSTVVPHRVLTLLCFDAITHVHGLGVQDFLPTRPTNTNVRNSILWLKVHGVCLRKSGAQTAKVSLARIHRQCGLSCIFKYRGWGWSRSSCENGSATKRAKHDGDCLSKHFARVVFDLLYKHIQKLSVEHHLDVCLQKFSCLV